MSTIRVPCRVSPRKQRHNGRIESSATKKTNAAEASPGHRAGAMGGDLLNDDLRADPDIAVTDELDSADVAVITDGLRAYDLNQTGYHDFARSPYWSAIHRPAKSSAGYTDGPNSDSSMSPGSFCQKIGAAHGFAAAYWRWRKKRADDAAALGSR
jgi:hypothetical protein